VPEKADRVKGRPDMGIGNLNDAYIAIELF
jgi:hypothetical protein